MALQRDFCAPGQGSPAVGLLSLPSQNSHAGSHGPLGCHQESWCHLYLTKVHTGRDPAGLALDRQPCSLCKCTPNVGPWLHCPSSSQPQATETSHPSLNGGCLLPPAG